VTLQKPFEKTEQTIQEQNKIKGLLGIDY